MTALRSDLPARREAARLLDHDLAEHLTFDAFAEQLTVSLAYANHDDLVDAKQTRDPRHPAALLDAFGYRARPAVFGRWGLQMRVFQPREGVRGTFDDTFVTFRGTETVLASPLGNVTGASRESAVDTDLGDFNRLGVGYGQYLPNAELVERNLHAGARASRGGRVVVTGHSLGGALAQIAASRAPGAVRQVLTWASPGIDREGVRAIDRYNLHRPARDRVQVRHYRTTTDVVPLGGQARLPGEVRTFERYENDGHRWKREAALSAPTVTHNNLVLAGMLAHQPGPLTPERQALLKYGAVDPDALKPDPSTGRPSEVWNVLHDLTHTRDDVTLSAETARRAALPALYGARLERTFRANLAYNLLLEEVERRVRALDPARLRRERTTLAAALAPIRAWLEATTEITVTQAAHDLAVKLGLVKDTREMIGRAVRTPVGARLVDDLLDRMGLKVGAVVKVPDRATQDLLSELLQHWYSWHPDGEDLYREERK